MKKNKFYMKKRFCYKLINIFLFSTVLILTLACGGGGGGGGSAEIASKWIPQDAINNNRVYYVIDRAADKDPTDDDGKSWDKAYGKGQLQAAIDAAASAVADGNQYYVAIQQGTYVPDTTASRSFSMKNKVTIIGGFLGTETNGIPIGGETILSGDLNGDDIYNTDGIATYNSTNSYHVFSHSSSANLNETAVLKNVTISGGNAIGTFDDGLGGGMLNIDSSPTLESCKFEYNFANFGGGMHNYKSSPSLTNCIFECNNASMGAGIYNASGSSPSLAGCDFSGNSTSGLGGGIYIQSGTITWYLPVSTFSGNTATNNAATNDISPAGYTITYTTP